MELARMTSKGQLTVPVAIRKKMGLDTGDQVLFYEKDGQMMITPLNADSLADAQLQAQRTRLYTVDEIRVLVRPIARKHKLKKLSLFGSYARGEATAESDVDLLADVPEGMSLWGLAAVVDDLENTLHKKVDLVTSGSLRESEDSSFVRNVQEDEVILYVEDRSLAA